MPNDLNPEYEVCGVNISLTAICHDAGLRAQAMGRDYIAAYYKTMKQLFPTHPALADYEAA